MKLTLKIDETQAVAVEPEGEGVRLTMLRLRKPYATVQLNQPTLGALLFAIEQAADAAAIASDRAYRERLSHQHGATA